MAASNSAAAPAPAPAKSKKLIIIGAIVALLVIGMAAALLFLTNKGNVDPYSDETPASKKAVFVPTFLPLENMVVNLADQGGDRFAQIGITLELQDEATAALVKQYMPSIRNGILMLVSQRSADELLLREGKEKLAADILREVTRPLGAGSARADAAEPEDDRPRRRSSPVRRVLFSSFIIQ